MSKPKKKPSHAKLPPVQVELLKLDLGCGPNKKAGFHGVDSIAFPGVDTVTDLRKRWPWPDASVSEIHASHVIEHFDSMERCHVANEMHRVLVPAGKVMLVVPSWSSCRAYGDPTHKWAPVSEFWFYYLSRAWRDGNAPHTDAKHLAGGFSCDFEAAWGYSMHQQIAMKNQEAQQFAMQFYKEAVQDIICTLTAKK